jgi:hypothetical protein|tara:strand:- start:380 stop:685 length:306 start_codon:yes stop_codon:yes gene_type:complete
MIMIPEGSLCLALFSITASTICNHESISYEIYEGETFVLLNMSEIEENNTIEFQILYENMQLWFNIHMNNHIIDNVRRAKSYDIPFMTLQEAELGSNTLTS